MVDHQGERAGIGLVAGVQGDAPDVLLGLVGGHVETHLVGVAAVALDAEALVAEGVFAGEPKDPRVHVGISGRSVPQGRRQAQRLVALRPVAGAIALVLPVLADDVDAPGVVGLEAQAGPDQDRPLAVLAVALLVLVNARYQSPCGRVVAFQNHAVVLVETVQLVVVGGEAEGGLVAERQVADDAGVATPVIAHVHVQLQRPPLQVGPLGAYHDGAGEGVPPVQGSLGAAQCGYRLDVEQIQQGDGVAGVVHIVHEHGHHRVCEALDAGGADAAHAE